MEKMKTTNGTPAAATSIAAADRALAAIDGDGLDARARGEADGARRAAEERNVKAAAEADGKARAAKGQGRA